MLVFKKQKALIVFFMGYFLKRSVNKTFRAIVIIQKVGSAKFISVTFFSLQQINDSVRSCTVLCTQDDDKIQQK